MPSPLEHPTPKSPEDWVRLLDAQLNPRFARRIQVTYGRARTTPIHVKWPPGRAEIRMHKMFEHAPEDVVQAVGQWLLTGRRARRACALLDEWIHRALGELPPKKPRQAKLQPAGDVHDLQQIAESLFEGEFAAEFGNGTDSCGLRPGLTFGRRSPSRSRHTLQLGSYSPEKNIVRVHPVLDQDAVPAWFVRYVLFHELLHAVLEGPHARRDGKRAPRVMHGPAFRNRERTYLGYEEAIAWERAHISSLIRSARSGKALPRVRRSKKVQRKMAQLQKTQPQKKPAEKPQTGSTPQREPSWVQRILFGRLD